MKFLIVVDMQNDFITGALGTKEAEAILPKVLEKIRTYRPEQIFVTQDTHPDNYLETNEGRHLPVAHCIAGGSRFESAGGRGVGERACRPLYLQAHLRFHPADR